MVPVSDQAATRRDTLPSKICLINELWADSGLPSGPRIVTMVKRTSPVGYPKSPTFPC